MSDPETKLKTFLRAVILAKKLPEYGSKMPPPLDKECLPYLTQYDRDELRIASGVSVAEQAELGIPPLEGTPTKLHRDHVRMLKEKLIRFLRAVRLAKGFPEDGHKMPPPLDKECLPYLTQTNRNELSFVSGVSVEEQAALGIPPLEETPNAQSAAGGAGGAPAPASASAAANSSPVAANSTPAAANSAPAAANSAPAAANSAPAAANNSPLPAGWTEHAAEDGRVFYYNAASNETQWDRPLPGGWTKHTAPDGRVYYHKKSTGETQWDTPANISAAGGAGAAAVNASAVPLNIHTESEKAYEKAIVKRYTRELDDALWEEESSGKAQASRIPSIPPLDEKYHKYLTPDQRTLLMKHGKLGLSPVAASPNARRATRSRKSRRNRSRKVRK